MARPSLRPGKVYATYEPYPVSWGSGPDAYEVPEPAEPDATSANEPDPHASDDLLDLIPDTPTAEWQEPVPPAREGDLAFSPLRLLRSLFAERLDLLSSALAELDGARQRREQLTGAALRDIDCDIQECERAIATLKQEKVLNNFERRRHIERQLVELKRQRRQETITSWRDLVSLGREIRALRREADSLGRTAATAGKEHAPT